MTENKVARNFGLDVMRAVAILLVLFYHSYGIARNINPGGKLLIGSGTLGVEIFFVLSGYLIFGILFKELNHKMMSSRDVLMFMMKRWLRTLPNYWIVLSLTAVIYFFFEKQQFIHFSYKFYFFIQNFASIPKHFFVSSWSLAVEEFSYLVMGLFCIMIGLMRIQDPEKRKKTFVWLIIGFAAAVKVINYYLLKNDLLQSDDWNSVVRCTTIFRMDSIFIGGLFAFWQNVRNEGFYKYATIKLLIGIIAVVAGTFFQKYALGAQDLSKNSLFYLMILPFISCGVGLTLPYIQNLEIKSNIIKYLVLKISLLSYSLYLVNEQVLDLLTHKLGPWEKYSSIQNFLFYLLAWILFFAISNILYKIVELPFMRLRSKIK